MRAIKKLLAFLCGLLLLVILLEGCTPRREEKKKELLCYCGITMEAPMHELATLLEQRKNCTVKFIIGASGDLFHMLSVNQVGDLYLPGLESYIEQAEQAGFISGKTVVGFNQVAMIVAAGNPLGIKAELHCFFDPDLRIVLGNASTGSIGRETKRILNQAGLYQWALENSLFLTSDSWGLTRALVEQKADLTLNWYATSHWPENREKIMALQLDENIAPRHRLILARLTFSPYPNIADAFLALAVSSTGQKIFFRYGFIAGKN
jgi:molybdate transport system substrate-binding protein